MPVSMGVENTAKPWHAVDADDVMRALNVTRDGLTSQEAQQMLEEHGYNELKEKKNRVADVSRRAFVFCRGEKDLTIVPRITESHML
jgi:hypothetical protein